MYSFILFISDSAEPLSAIKIWPLKFLISFFIVLIKYNVDSARLKDNIAIVKFSPFSPILLSSESKKSYFEYPYIVCFNIDSTLYSFIISFF